MNEIEEILRKEAIFLKLSGKGQTPVSVNEMIKVFKALSDSYNAFVEIKYSKINNNASKQVKSALSEENSLVIVDLKFESFGARVSPQTVYYHQEIPEIKLKKQLEWKSEVFFDFKSMVLSKDYNNQKEIKKINKEFSPEERIRVYKPVIDDIINNPNVNTFYQLGENGPVQKFNRVKLINKGIILPKPVKKPAPELKTKLALIQLKNEKLDKVLELFDEEKSYPLKFESLTFGDMEYKFNYNLYTELIKENDKCFLLEHKQFGIYANGETIEEAQLNFAEEFDYIFRRYNSLNNSDLTDDVIRIKYLLNDIVK